MTDCSTATDSAATGQHSAAGVREREVARLRTRLMGYAAKFLWNPHDAEEVVQDAFKEAVKTGLAVCDERVLPWLFRTVGNLCRNLRRKKRPEALAEWVEPSTGTTPGGEMQRAEELERLRAAVRDLPEQQRTALVLRTMERMEYAQVAEIMELSVAAVRTHVHLARRRLADVLGKETNGGSENRP
jgi:RNA polymerase sigma-70 factor (ECF subfamily)